MSKRITEQRITKQQRTFLNFLRITFVILFLSPAFAQSNDLPKLNNDNIEEIIAALTLEQKVNLVTGTGMPGMSSDGSGPAVGDTQQSRVPGAAGNTFPIDAMNIPAVVLADGPAGVRIHPTRPNDDKTYHGTAFPIASLLASSWDLELVEEMGKSMGRETKEYGIDVLLAPALNIHRYALGGRNFEYFSEDPLLSGKMASAIVKGVQSQGVGTSIKHYVANNHEWNRGAIDIQVDQRALREIYLRGFEIAIKEAQPWTVMSSYNKVNGEYTSESEFLLMDVLRDQWGFQGLVMTDWFGGQDAVQQMRAGNDLLMPGVIHQREEIISAVKNGTLDVELLDRNVANILRLVLKSPVYQNYDYSETPDLTTHASVARRVASEGMVLLKNDQESLPLKPSTKLAVFGNYSYDMVTGGTGSGDVNEAYVISMVEGLESAGISVDRSFDSTYNLHIKAEKAKLPPIKNPIEAYYPKKPLPELQLTKSQVSQLAKNSDAALLTIGRSSGEFKDRDLDDFYLTEKEQSLINMVSDVFSAAGKPVVVVLNIGGVIETANWNDKVDAIVLAYQPGQEAGNAIADVLVGKVNPSGKLIDTFPIAIEDYPAHAGFPGVVTDPDAKPRSIVSGLPSYNVYEEGIFVGYRHFNTNNVAVAYPFGFGLSYTTFKYSKPKLNKKVFDDTLTVSIKITNSGKVAGREVVQLYVSAPDTNMVQPSEELRAFAKTKLLKPGESQTVTFELSSRDIASFDTKETFWVAHAGEYEIKIGASSRDFKQKKTFKVKDAIKIKP